MSYSSIYNVENAQIFRTRNYAAVRKMTNFIKRTMTVSLLIKIVFK